MFAYKHRMITSAIIKADICLLFYFIKYLIWYFKLGITDKKSKKESNSMLILLMLAALPIAPFICEHCL